MNIKEVAARAGLPAKTIRYYEEIGLIRPLRAANGYRAFRDSDLHKLAFLGRARSLGFTIEECRALLALYEDQARASADVKALAQSHLEQIAAKIEELKADLVEKGRISQEEGRQFVDDLLRRSEKARDQLDLWINKRVEERIEQFNLATRDELADLRRQVEELQVALNRDRDE